MTTTAPATLRDLRDALLSGNTWDGAPTAHGEIDWTALPTFGGEAPADTTGVWSWDATHLLVGEGRADLQIVARAEYERA